MTPRNRKFRNGIVYSTDPEYRYDNGESAEQPTPPPSEQDLRVSLDKKLRAGKKVTLVSGFTGTVEDLKSVCNMLKNRFGAGGTAKNGEILIQGDFREQTIRLLSEKGYHVKKSGG